MKKLVSSILAVIAGCFASNASALYVVGSGCEAGWSPEKALEMTEVSTNVFTWTGQLKSDGEFKFIVARDWHPSITCDFNTENQRNETVESGNTYNLFVRQNDREGKDNKFQVSVTGIYTLNVDLNDMKMYAALDKESEEPITLYMVGDATPAGWDTNNSKRYKMEKDGLTYKWTGPLTKFGEGRFVFLAKEGEWYPRYTNNADNKCLEMSAGQQYELKRFEGNADTPALGVEKPGIYTVTVTLSDDLQSGHVSIEEAAICIIGPAISGKWAFEDISNNEFTSDGNGRYTFTGNVTLNSDNANDAGKFRINQKGKWTPAFFPVDGGTSLIPEEGGTFDARWHTSDNVEHFKVSAEGNYTFVLDLTDTDSKKPRLTVTRNGGAEPEKPLTELYICGNAIVKDGGNSWEQNEQYIQSMTSTETPGQFTWTGDMYQNGEFKFRLNSHESGDWTGFVAAEANKTATTGEKLTILPSAGNNDYKFVVPEDGHYTVTANTYGDDKYISVEKRDVTGITGITDGNAAVIINGRNITVSVKAGIFDMMGRAVTSIAAGNSATLPAGIYLVVTNGKATRIAVK